MAEREDLLMPIFAKTKPNTTAADPNTLEEEFRAAQARMARLQQTLDVHETARREIELRLRSDETLAAPETSAEKLAALLDGDDSAVNPQRQALNDELRRHSGAMRVLRHAIGEHQPVLRSAEIAAARARMREALPEWKKHLRIAALAQIELLLAVNAALALRERAVGDADIMGSDILQPMFPPRSIANGRDGCPDVLDAHGETRRWISECIEAEILTNEDIPPDWVAAWRRQ
jgi:hypothetical protein